MDKEKEGRISLDCRYQLWKPPQWLKHVARILDHHMVCLVFERLDKLKVVENWEPPTPNRT